MGRSRVEDSGSGMKTRWKNMEHECELCLCRAYMKRLCGLCNAGAKVIPRIMLRPIRGALSDDDARNLGPQCWQLSTFLHYGL